MTLRLGPHRFRGFTMVSMLIVVAIIGILFVIQFKSMQQTKTKVFQPGGGSSSVIAPSAGNATTINSLKQLHLMQMAYYQRYNKYATFEELLADGSIPTGYAAREDEKKGIAFVRYYDLEFSASAEHYIIIAFPNSEAATAFPDDNLPAYRIDETGEVKEEEGIGDSEGLEPSEGTPAADSAGDESMGGLLDTPTDDADAPPAEEAPVEDVGTV